MEHGVCTPSSVSLLRKRYALSRGCYLSDVRFLCSCYVGDARSFCFVVM